MSSSSSGSKFPFLDPRFSGIKIFEVKIGTIVAGVESSHKSWKPQSGESKHGKSKSLKSKSGKSKSGKSKYGKSKSGNPKSRKSDIEKQ